MNIPMRRSADNVASGLPGLLIGQVIHGTPATQVHWMPRGARVHKHGRGRHWKRESPHDRSLTNFNGYSELELSPQFIDLGRKQA